MRFLRLTIVASLLFVTIATVAIAVPPWTTQVLEPPEGRFGDGFGRALAVDGQLLVIGAPYDDEPGLSSGSAFVFERSRPDRTWHLVSTLPPVVGYSYDAFGSSVAILGDEILVGSPGDDRNTWNSGAIFVFRQSGTAWRLVQTLRVERPLSNTYFGGSLATSSRCQVVGGLGRWRSAGCPSLFTSRTRAPVSAPVPGDQGSAEIPHDRTALAAPRTPAMPHRAGSSGRCRWRAARSRPRPSRC